MSEVRITDRNGNTRSVEADNGRQLMEALRDADTGIQGTCGGGCSCGTCHVYIAAQWAGKLKPRSEDEQMMLEALADLVEIKPESRLSCQIVMSDELSGLEVTVAPEA
jgi:2Fe-2S ferredoxin